MLRRLGGLLVIGVAVVVLGACGHKGASSGSDVKANVDADPLALLPPSPLVIARLDARAVFDSPSLGPQVTTMTDALVPLADDANLRASRDVDRIVVASYAMTGADIAAVLCGHFDQAAIAATTHAKNGSAIIKGTYAGFATSTIGPVMLSAVTSATLVAGTGDGVRRVLERIQQGKLERSLPAWENDTLDTKGADIALAADFGSQSLASAAMNVAALPWLNSVQVARVIGNFQSPGMNFAATLTYPDAQHAESAADGVRVVNGWLKVLGPMLGGIKVQNLDVRTEASDLHCTFAVDDQTLRTLTALIPRYVAPAGQ